MTDQSHERRRLPYDAFTECWYVPGETHIVDLIHPDDGLTLHYSEEADAVRARYPNAERMTCDTAWTAIDAAAHATYQKDVTEIDEARFLDALNVLPPVGWTTRGGVESFKMSERLWGNITDIFAHVGNRYFTLTDDIRLSAAEIARRVHAFIALPSASNNKQEPDRPDHTTPSAHPRPNSGDPS